MPNEPAVYSEREILTLDLAAGQAYAVNVDSSEEKFEYIVEQNIVRNGEIITINKMKYGPFEPVLDVGGTITLGAKFGQPEKSLWALDLDGKPLKYYTSVPDWSKQEDVESVDSMADEGEENQLPVLLILTLSIVVILIFGIWYRARANKK